MEKKQIEIKFNNCTFKGEKMQELLFRIFDLNDSLGRPFIFILEENNGVENFKLDPVNYKIKSTKFEFSRIIWNAMEKWVIQF